MGVLADTQRERPTGASRRTPRLHVSRRGRAAHQDHDLAAQDRARAFTPLIDAKAASKLLGVPYTWLLAQARARQIPHHRLGHYVRFNPDDLKQWLTETRTTPNGRY
jgi:excisionase family DNA binding protein